MKITIELDLSIPEARHLLSNSLERVMNNAIFVGNKTESVKEASDVGLAERASTLWQDCEALKPLADKLWRTAQEAYRVAKAT